MKKVTIKIGSEITLLDSDNLPDEIMSDLNDTLIMPNPKYMENLRYRYSTAGVPQYLHYIRRNRSGNFVMPRGYVSEFRRLLARHRYRVKVIDNTLNLPPISFEFRGRLDEHHQVPACSDILKRKHGVLCSPTGSGKTVMGLYIMCERAQPTLIIVHTKELLYQWAERITEFTNVGKSQIGMIGDGHKKIGKRVTIAIINSLYNMIDEVEPYIGHIICDECHRVPSKMFTNAIKKFRARYLLGLSATPYRRDKLTKVLHFYLGDLVHEVEIKGLQERGKIMTPTLEIIQSDFAYYSRSTSDYAKIIKALVSDVNRTDLIVNAVREHVRRNRGIALVISDRIAHCDKLYNGLLEHGVKALMLTSQTPKKARKQIIECLNKGMAEVLVATGRLIGEGNDIKNLSSIFIAMPIKWIGRVIQYIGRILRTKKGKRRAVIYDVLDNQWLLKNSFRSRLKAYEHVGIDTKEIRKLLR